MLRGLNAEGALSRRHLVLGTLLCGSGGALNARPVEHIDIGFIPKQVNNPYSQLIFEGVQAAAREMGGKAAMAGPDSAGAQSQAPHLEEMIRKRPNAIILAANDQVALLPLLRNAAREGIKVVAVDSDMATDARALFVNQASQEGVGRAQMRLLGQLMNWKGSYAVLSATPNADNQNAWIYWMAQEARRPEYREMERVAIAYGNDDLQASTDQMQHLLATFPKLQGVVAPTAVGIVAAAKVLRSVKDPRRICLTGLGTPNAMRPFVLDGTVNAFQLWNPRDLGYLASYAAQQLATDTIQGKKGETFTAGRLGSYSVQPRGEIVLGSPTTFDRNNIGSFDF